MFSQVNSFSCTGFLSLSTIKDWLFQEIAYSLKFLTLLVNSIQLFVLSQILLSWNPIYNFFSIIQHICHCNQRLLLLSPYCWFTPEAPSNVFTLNCLVTPKRWYRQYGYPTLRFVSLVRQWILFTRILTSHMPYLLSFHTSVRKNTQIAT